MYGLLISHLAADLTTTVIEVERKRYLEYTVDEISDQLESLSKESVDFLTSYPAIVTDEGKGSEVARVVRITGIEASLGTVGFRFKPLTGSSQLLNEVLWKLRTELDIAQFEFNRNHFAVKDRDLLKVLKTAGYSYAKNQMDSFRLLPLPAPSRSELLGVKNEIQSWSHADLDDLMLEIGIKTLKAGREIGSARDRAAALVRFALEHPKAVTAERHLLSAFLARKSTSRPVIGKPNVQTQAKLKSSEFRDSEKSRSPNRVSIVHGQNEVVRTEVVSFLDSMGLQGIVLHDQPNMGRHLLTKFIEEAELVTFAIIIMTDDDVGGLKGKSLRARARQNVILELGYFLSHLGQQRVCALVTPGLETPSDFDGIVYIQMDNRGEWKKFLSRELAAAEMPVVDQKPCKVRENDVGLTSEAKTLLKAAASDTDGTILKVPSLSGVEIQAGDQVFGAENSREAAKWGHALDILVAQGLVVPRGIKGQMFEITHQGWTFADTFLLSL